MHLCSTTDHLVVMMTMLDRSFTYRKKLLPVQYHSELLAKQYWLSCYQSHHPCHHLTSLPASARNMKGTLMKFNIEVVSLSEEGITDVDTYCNCLCTLHSQAVIEARVNFVPNRVLRESLALYHPIFQLLKIFCFLVRSVPYLPSCVPVTVSS